MKNLILAILTAGIAVSCNTVKNTTAKVNKGNYDEAIEITLDKLRKNPEKKRKQEYVLLLEEAFAKAKASDENRISFLKLANNNADLKEMYDLYVSLDRRQNSIAPLLPISVVSENRDAYFDFKNYNEQIVNTRDALATYLYAEANARLNNANSKEDFRNAYYDLYALNKLVYAYKDVKDLMDIAHTNGINHVNVSLQNESQIALPIQLENDLLDFSSYGMDDFWTVYHSNASAAIDYDYNLDVAFTQIDISPEYVKERVLRTEKRIKDGTKFLKDDEGNYVLDEDGERIEVDNFITVRARYFEFEQNKAVSLVGRVRYTDARTGEVIESFPLVSEFIFDHRYANYRGDRRALNSNHIALTRNRPMAFPTNEQMIYDAGDDLKNRLKGFIVNI